MIKLHIKLQTGDSNTLIIASEKDRKCIRILLDNIEIDTSSIKELLIKFDEVETAAESSKAVEPNNEVKAMLLRDAVNELTDNIEMLSTETLEKELDEIIRANDIVLARDGTIINDNVSSEVVDRFDLIRDELDYRKNKHDK